MAVAGMTEDQQTVFGRAVSLAPAVLLLVVIARLVSAGFNEMTIRASLWRWP